VYDLIKGAKYKYRLTVSHAIKTYYGKFNDELDDHLLSIDMNNFWRVWSSKICYRVVNISCIDGEVDEHKAVEIFCKKFCEPLVIIISL
jgi:hypothetical protein